MFRLCRYVFYRLYCFASIWGTWWDSTPHITAIFTMTLLSWSTAFCLLSTAEWLLRRPLLPSLSNTGVVASMVVLFIATYFIFVHRGRYLAIVNEFKGETARHRRMGAFALASYVVFLYVFFLYVAIQRGKALGLKV